MVTRYATTSAGAADENQRRVEAVFDELAAAKPDNVSYIVLRSAETATLVGVGITVIDEPTTGWLRGRFIAGPADPGSNA